MADNQTDFIKAFNDFRGSDHLSLPQGWDLTDITQDPVLENLATAIVDLYIQNSSSYEAVLQAEQLLTDDQANQSVLMLLALKMAKSKIEVMELSQKCHITWTVPVYGEQNRVKKRAEHEAGEDFVRRKVQQMSWLIDGTDNLTYDLMFVDDGCKHGSGNIIKGIIEEEGFQDCSVIFLQEGIDAGQPEWLGCATTRDSIKGGACQYAMWRAKDRDVPDDRLHVIGFTDSDLSSHLAQSGSLVKACVEGAVLASATRYEDGGVYCSAFQPEPAFCLKSRSAGNLAFRHALRKKILPPLKDIFDTQCGFKLFRKEALDLILPKIADKKASFDMELILVSGTVGKVQRVPVVWIESLAESNFWGSSDSVYESYFKIGKRMVLLNKTHLSEMTEGDQESSTPYVDFLESLELDDFKGIMSVFVPTLTDDVNLYEVDLSVDLLEHYMSLGAQQAMEQEMQDNKEEEGQ